MMIPDLPLYRLEHARRRLEDILGVSGECCMFDIDDSHHHDVPDLELSMDPEYETIRDLLDRAIETKRAERDQALAGVRS